VREPLLGSLKIQRRSVASASAQSRTSAECGMISSTMLTGAEQNPRANQGAPPIERCTDNATLQGRLWPEAILMGLLMTAKAAGVHPGDYFNDVLLRLSTCTDVRKLTPHGWQQHFAAEVTERRHALLLQILGSA
jgi:hypothetical protein